jgi:hypothetical protein
MEAGFGFRGSGKAGLEQQQLLEGAVVAALGGIEAAMEAGQGVRAEDEGPAGRDKIFLGAPLMHGVLPELGLGFAEAAELPLGGYHGIDEEALLGSGGLKAVIMLDGEGFEDVRDLAGDEVGVSVNAGFEGIEAGNGLALFGAGAGGVLRVAAIRLNLTDSSHTFRLQVSRRVGARRVVVERKCFSF